MPQIHIESLDDSRLEPYRDLKATNETRRRDSFVVEGEKLARRLLASEHTTLSMLIGRRRLDEFSLPVPHEVPLLIAPDAWLERIVGFNFHRGVLACGRRGDAPQLDALIARLPQRCTLVVGIDIQDPENLGAMIRTARALGVAGMILGGRSADPFSRRVLRVSMGASLSLPIVTSADLAGDLARLRRRWQVELVATVLDPNAQPLARCPRSERLAVVFGNEGWGLDPKWLELCDCQATIPMAEGIDSLNVAVAAGIVLHHFAVPRSM